MLKDVVTLEGLVAAVSAAPLLSPTMLLSGDWYDKSNREIWVMPKAFDLAFNLTSHD